jgi:hypothetical protein
LAGLHRGSLVSVDGREYTAVNALRDSLRDILAIHCPNGWGLVPARDLGSRNRICAALHRPKISEKYGAGGNKSDWHERYWQNWKIFNDTKEAHQMLWRRSTASVSIIRNVWTVFIVLIQRCRRLSHQKNDRTK